MQMPTARRCTSRARWLLGFAVLVPLGCGDLPPPFGGVSASRDGGTGGSKDTGAGEQPRTGEPWIAAYYPGWKADRLPLSAIDWGVVTHVIHFALIPSAGDAGSLIDDQTNSLGPAASAAVIKAAHDAGRKALVAVGGSGAGSAHFLDVLSDAIRPAFIDALVGEVQKRGYDGIDVDIESRKVDAATFQKFSRELRDKIDAVAPGMLLTTAGLGASGDQYGPVADAYDWVDIMTYDLVYGPDVTWHDSALTGGGGDLYSVERAVREYVGAGVPASKIGIGLKCGGFTFSGASAPMQPFTGRPTSIAYVDVMARHFSDEVYRWDDAAQVSYLSVATPAPMFVTFDDARSARAKLDYVMRGGYGGIIVWDPSESYDATKGPENPLLEALKPADGG
jgi:chitinase